MKDYGRVVRKITLIFADRIPDGLSAMSVTVT